MRKQQKVNIVWTQKPIEKRAHDLQQKAADKKITTDPSNLNARVSTCLRAAIVAIREQATILSQHYGVTDTRAQLILIRQLRDQLNRQMEIVAARAMQEGETIASIGRASGYDRTAVRARFTNIEELADRLPKTITEKSRDITTKDGKTYQVRLWAKPSRKAKTPETAEK